MRKIKIAQIGTSAFSHGNDIFMTLKKQADIFDIAGFCFPLGEREKYPFRMKEFEGYRELSIDEIMSDNSIEAVAIETEERYLSKYAILAAKHGKHIHMEKPGGMLLCDFEELVKTVKEHNVTLHIGYMYRYNPEILKLKDSIRNGELGEIISVEAQMNCLQPPELRKWLADIPGGMMFFLGCHLVDIITDIIGEPKRIIPLNRSSGLGEINAEDFCMVLFEYERGISFAKVSAVEVGGFMRRQLVVSGSEKTVEIKPLEFWSPLGFEHGMYSGVTEYDKKDWCYTPKSHNSDYYDRYEEMMSAFAKIVKGEIENPRTPERELALYKTLIECCK